MLAPLRRCPASLPRTFRCAALSRTALCSVPLSTPRIALSQSRIAPLLSVRGFQSSIRLSEDPAVVGTIDSANNSGDPNGPITKFQDLAAKGLVHPNLVRAITQDMGIETMTPVQSQTINKAIEGVDIIAQAKTGTGKTIGFLLPMLQNIINNDDKLAAALRFRRLHVKLDIRAIVISPTRELAEQIAVEARKLTRHTGIVVQTAVGGTGKKEGLRKIKKEGCHVLVATPGRLQDLLSDPYSGVQAPDLSYFILDEADRLLQTGFWEALTDIQALLPDRKVRDRQTLMFSATVPQDVIRLVRETLKPGFHYVQTVSKDEVPTHHRVPQKAVVANVENQLPALLELIQRELKRSASGETRPFKAIVFFNTLKQVMSTAEAFREMRKDFYPANLFSIHSDMTQAGRQRAADKFRAAQSAILLSTDVTARGMDFPNVTHVIQVGLPGTREDYIHRIGRTGRAGKEGEAWLFYSDSQYRDFKFKCEDLPLKKDHSLAAASVNLREDADLPAHVAELVSKLSESFKRVDPSLLAETYRSLLAAVSSKMGSPGTYLEELNALATKTWGMESPPYLSPALTQKLGIDKYVGSNTGRASRGRSAFHASGSSDALGGAERAYRGGERGFRGGDRSFRGGDRSFRSSDRSFRDGDRSFRDGDRSFRDDDRSFGARKPRFDTSSHFRRGGPHEREKREKNKRQNAW